jgi:starch phosphorylase
MRDGGADVDRAVAELAERLPSALRPRARVAFNYRWSWACGGAAVFRDIDPLLWERSQQNSRAMVEMTRTARLQQLASDSRYRGRVETLAAELEADLRRPAATGITGKHPVAYFCSEFAIHQSLPLYRASACLPATY